MRMEGDGSVICVDAVLPPMGNVGGTPAKLMDVNMLVFIPGKERTLEQWGALYESAGFKTTSTTTSRQLRDGHRRGQETLIR